MKTLDDLGRCTMPGCLSQAFWVHGIPMEDSSGKEVFPWRLCNCCQESVLAAEALLHGDVAVSSGIVDPEPFYWCTEAARVALKQIDKEA